jgi:hypothetical protein
MPRYRFYRIGDDGHILGMPDVVDCSDDADAIEKATARAITCEIDIWDLGRRVAIVRKRESSHGCDGQQAQFRI